MKVLVFNGSPRKGGNTELLLHAMIKGVELAGGEAEVIRLCDLNIQPCIGCGGCDKTGKCVLEDDMIGLCEKIIASKRVIIASPIYFYGVTAQTKAFIDRTQSLWSWKRLMAEKGEWQDDSERKGLLVSVAATHGEKVFDGAILTVKYAFDAMGISYDGAFLVRGVDRRGEMAQQADKLKQAEEIGKAFAR